MWTINGKCLVLDDIIRLKKIYFEPYLEAIKLNVLIPPGYRDECVNVGRKEKRDSGCDLPGLSCHG